MLQASYQASGSADLCLILAIFCVCLLKVRQIATVEPLEVLVVMLVGSTWQQFIGRSVYKTGSTALL